MLYQDNDYFKIIIMSILLFALSAFSNKEKANETLIEEMSEALYKSNIEIDQKNRDCTNTLEIKLSKAETEDRAAIWFPKAAKAKKTTII